MISNTKSIIFNTEMVKAILDGKKTQTRRAILKDFMKIEIEKDIFPQEVKFDRFKDYCPCLNFKDNGNAVFQLINRSIKPLPFCDGICTEIDIKLKYKVGDILYVRETFYPLYNDEDSCVYKADYPLHWTAVDAVYGDIETDTETEKRTVWKPSIHMPKKYARIFLKVTNVRVEKLKDMKIEDFLHEGINNNGFIVKEPENGLNECYKYLKEKWISLWNSTSKDGYKWEDDPFVFVYEFERIKL